MICQGCASSTANESDSYKLPDTLRVGTLYSPTSFSSIEATRWAMIMTEFVILRKTKR